MSVFELRLFLHTSPAMGRTITTTRKKVMQKITNTRSKEQERILHGSAITYGTGIFQVTKKEECKQESKGKRKRYIPVYQTTVSEN